MTAPDRFPRPRGRQDRELAVLVGGPWSGFWYWRDHLELQQVAAKGAAGRCTTGVPSRKCLYEPTEVFRSNPEKPAEQGREWRWTGGAW